MKTTLFVLLNLFILISASAKNALILTLTSRESIIADVSKVDSIYTNPTADSVIISYDGQLHYYARTNVENITTGTYSSTFTVSYQDSVASVINPYAFSGVGVTIDGGHVCINSTATEELEYVLSGTSANGSFKIYSSKKYKITLKGIDLTNPSGPVINSQSKKNGEIKNQKGYVNILTDGATYAKAPKGEDQKGCIFSEGQLIFKGAGEMKVNALYKHGICSDDYIDIENGTITVTSASDAIHANDSIRLLGGTVHLYPQGDGLDCTGALKIVEGTIDAHLTGEDTKAVKSDSCIIVDGGTITIENSGAGGRGLSTDGNIIINGGDINIQATGEGGVVKNTDTPPETPKSYKVFFKKPSSTMSSPWTTLALYKNDGTLVQNLTNTTNVTGSNGTTATFYYYDFKESSTDTYYLKSADYTSRRTTYSIVSATFTGPTSGIDYYYEISNSYTTQGTTRTYSLASVNSIYGGGSDTEESGETYNASCIKADSSVTINGGTLVLSNSGAMSKSIKAGNSTTTGTFTMNGGNLQCNITGTMYLNGKDASYCTAIKTDYYKGNGGTITINASEGKASRGISADEDLTINDGNYTIINSCNGYAASNDNYTAKAISCDANVKLLGGTFNISMSGTGGKGIKADGTYTQGTKGTDGPVINIQTSGQTLSSQSSSGGSSGGRNDFGGGFAGPGGGGMGGSTGSSSKAIKAEGIVNVNSGSLYVTTKTDGAEGLESKTSVNINGGTHYFQCYDDCINSSGNVCFNGGTTVCYSNGNDAVDSNAGRTGAITIAGGNVFAYTSKGTPEEGLDCDNNSYIVVTGGIAVSAGGSQGGGSSSSIGSSTQGYYLGSSPSSYGSTYYYTLCNTSGEAICTFKFAANVSNSLSLLTAPNLGKGTITVKQGTVAPTEADINVNNCFWINPKVVTTGTTATLTSK